MQGDVFNGLSLNELIASIKSMAYGQAVYGLSIATKMKAFFAKMHMRGLSDLFPE